MSTQYDSRTADKFVVRLPDGLRDSIQGAADYLDTSMNTVFVQAVRQYLDSQKRQQLLLDALTHYRPASPVVEGLQRDLTQRDERIDQLEVLLHRWADLLGVSAPDLRDETLAALKPVEAQQCQFPQSCPSNCGCDIPDFTPGNGNKARRRAEAIEALKPENQRIVPVDPFTTCLNCFGTGTICTGILEASSTICNGCNGTGREQP